MKETIDVAGRRASLDDYRSLFDKALVEVRVATERAGHADSDWTGPAKARAEISEAREKAERDYERIGARRPLMDSASTLRSSPVLSRPFAAEPRGRPTSRDPESP
jgi:hypothetical protein